MPRRYLFLFLIVLPILAQKKPVTLDALKAVKHQKRIRSAHLGSRWQDVSVFEGHLAAHLRSGEENVERIGIDRGAGRSGREKR